MGGIKTLWDWGMVLKSKRKTGPPLFPDRLRESIKFSLGFGHNSIYDQNGVIVGI